MFQPPNMLFFDKNVFSENEACLLSNEPLDGWDILCGKAANSYMIKKIHVEDTSLLQARAWYYQSSTVYSSWKKTIPVLGRRLRAWQNSLLRKIWIWNLNSVEVLSRLMLQNHCNVLCMNLLNAKWLAVTRNESLLQLTVEGLKNRIPHFLSSKFKYPSLQDVVLQTQLSCCSKL